MLHAVCIQPIVANKQLAKLKQSNSLCPICELDLGIDCNLHTPRNKLKLAELFSTSDINEMKLQIMAGDRSKDLSIPSLVSIYLRVKWFENNANKGLLNIKLFLIIYRPIMGFFLFC